MLTGRFLRGNIYPAIGGRNMKNKNFYIEFDKNTGCITKILMRHDKYKMNWVGNTKKWGGIYAPPVKNRNFGEEIKTVHFEETKNSAVTVFENDKLQITVTRSFTKEGSFKEEYKIKNIFTADVFFTKGNIGIYTPLCDEYRSAAESCTTKCNAHIWCGESISYINALRQGKSNMNLGLVLTNGSLECYSIDRENQTLNTAQRGNIILHPELPPLCENEEYTLSWEIFIHSGNGDFKKQAESYHPLYALGAENYTVFPNEKMEFFFPYIDGAKVFYKKKELVPANKNGKMYVEYYPKSIGEYRFCIVCKDVKTHIIMYKTDFLENIIKKRISFIVEKQQYHNPKSRLDGAYLVYDCEDKRMYFDAAFTDHNASRERIGMGILIARYLQKHKNRRFYKSLMKYKDFVLREFTDEKTGEVFNSAGRKNEWLRLYNAPWVMNFMAELYNLTGDKRYIECLFNVILKFYELGGERFYPNAVSIRLIYETLLKSGREDYAKKAKELFLRHAENMIKTGLNYPPHEVCFEQTIVTPAVTIICEAGKITNDESFKEKVREHLFVLELFKGMQPDYRLNNVSIRYWDDYWFGKAGLYTDTLPHYWSCLTQRAECDYYLLSGDKKYLSLAKSGIQNCLCLFRPDGSASAAYVYPFTTDGIRGEFYDPFANDQDFALYYALTILK